MFTAFHGPGEYVLARSLAPYGLRSATDLPSANWLSAKYSIWATSGTPLPACTAFCSAEYWSLPVPALTRFTCTLGYLAWKSVTTCLRVGSQAHTVIDPPLASADVAVAASVP